MKKIVILDYYSKGRIALMKYDWFDTLSQSGVKTNECDFTFVNVQCHLRIKNRIYLPPKLVKSSMLVISWSLNEVLL